MDYTIALAVILVYLVLCALDTMFDDRRFKDTLYLITALAIYVLVVEYSKV